VRGVELRVKSAAATEFALQWKTAPDASWNAIPVQSLPAGEWTTVRFECAGHPAWSGEVWQFRFMFKASPEQLDMDWVKTF